VTYSVRSSLYADDYIKSLKARAHRADGTEKTGSKELTAYNALRTLLDKAIPNYPFDLKFALGNRAGVRLNGIYRGKIGRLRVFWIASSTKQEIIILFIGYRKSGDKKDAYEQFVRYLKAGIFDHHFDEKPNL
jgi:mRNA-degrading endonuclease RelE of RelBE toxin-antitoxin system